MKPQTDTLKTTPLIVLANVHQHLLIALFTISDIFIVLHLTFTYFTYSSACKVKKSIVKYLKEQGINFMIRWLYKKLNLKINPSLKKLLQTSGHTFMFTLLLLSTTWRRKKAIEIKWLKKTKEHGNNSCFQYRKISLHKSKRDKLV